MSLTRAAAALVLAHALVLAACGDADDFGGRDAGTRDAATRDAAADAGGAPWQADAWAGDAAPSTGQPWTGWHGGDGDCLDVGEPLVAPYCIGDYCLEQPTLPLGAPLAVDGSAADDVWVLKRDRVLRHRGCSGWSVVSDALPGAVRCVSVYEWETCVDEVDSDEVDSENCAPVCQLVVAGPSSVWLLSDTLWRFDGEAFRRWTDGPDDIARLQKVGDDVWVISYSWDSPISAPLEAYRLEGERFVRHAGGALDDLEYPAALYGSGDDVWALSTNSNAVVRWDGTSWQRIEPSPPVGTQQTDLARFDTGEVWASNGVDVRRWTDGGWERVIEHAGRITSVTPSEVWLTTTEWNGTGYDYRGDRFDGSQFHPVEYPAEMSAQQAFGGAMWITEGGGGLARYVGGAWQFELGEAGEHANDSLTGFAGAGDELWATSSDGRAATRLWRRGADGFENVHEEPGLYGLYVRAAGDAWAFGESDGVPGALHWDGSAWQAPAQAPPAALVQMWSDGTTVLGLSATRVYGYDGATWRARFELPTAISANAMYVAGQDDIWLVGERDLGFNNTDPWVARWDGSALRELPVPARADWLYSVAGTGPDDVWVATEDAALRWQDGEWVEVASQLQRPLLGLLPAGEGNLLICDRERIVRWNGTDLEDVALDPPQCPMYAASPTDFWAPYLELGQNERHNGTWHAQLR